MGILKQAQIQEEDRQRRRAQESDWPVCLRCAEPIEHDRVILDENGDPEEDQEYSLCSYCDHVLSKDD